MATIAERIADLNAALDALIMGQAEVSVSHNGKSVSFKPGDEAAIRRRISELESQQGGRRRALKPIF